MLVDSWEAIFSLEVSARVSNGAAEMMGELEIVS